MKQILKRLIMAILTGAIIGAVAGLALSGFDLSALLDGAFIGAAIGALFGLRTQVIRRSASEAGIALRADKRDTS